MLQYVIVCYDQYDIICYALTERNLLRNRISSSSELSGFLLEGLQVGVEDFSPPILGNIKVVPFLNLGISLIPSVCMPPGKLKCSGKV